MSRVLAPAIPPWAFLSRPFAILAMLSSGAMFGFFYAWVSSTMWGLDAADPNVAISAMQAMNASVRNPVFALGYFGTPLALAAGTLVALKRGERRAALVFGSGGLLYVLGVVLPTSMFNVPLNEMLAAVEAPLAVGRAREVWQSYSAPWQFWNSVRAVAAGSVLLLAGAGVLGLARPRGDTPPCAPTIEASDSSQSTTTPIASRTAAVSDRTIQ